MTIADEVSWAVEHLARARADARIVFDQDAPLAALVKTGEALDEPLTARLLLSVFGDGSSQRHGAAVVREGVLRAAGCFLFPPQAMEALTVDSYTVGVRVDEGRIEAVADGRAHILEGPDALREWLEEKLLPDPPLPWRLGAAAVRRLRAATAPPPAPREVFVDATLDGKEAERFVFVLGAYGDTMVFGEEATGEEIEVERHLIEEKWTSLTPGAQVSLVFVGGEGEDDGQ